MIELLKHWNKNLEVCGVILNREKVVVCENRSTTPHESFQISSETLESLGNTPTHFWHTHPSNCVNLSMDDYKAFLNFPDQIHLIVGQDKIAEYYVVAGVVYRREYNAHSL
jgi:hypothetical protein